MKKLLHFLPIICEQGQGMKPYNISNLLAKLKRVYAEKAVRTGFDDSIYSDELLTLKDADLNAFNDLKAIVGTTKKEKAPTKITVNENLNDQEYEQAQKGSKKSKTKFNFHLTVRFY